MKLDTVKVTIDLNGSPCEAADVRRLRYVEGISELCEADMVVALSSADAAQAVAGAKARFTVARGDDHANERWISGILQSVEHLDQGDGLDATRPLFRLRLVPHVWRTTLTRRTRTYVHKSVDDALKEVWGFHSLDAPDAVSGAKHDLIVQYQESDFAFFSRLLEDTGTLHFIDQKEDEDTLVLRPAAGFRGLAGAPRPLHWTSRVSGESDDEGVTRAGHITGLSFAQVKQADVDRRRPKPEIRGQASRAGLSYTTIEERAPLFDRNPDGGRHATLVSDEQLPAHERFWLETSDLQVRAGEAVDAELARGEIPHSLLVVRVEHSFETSEDGAVYQNRAEAVLLDAGYFPARVTPRPSIVAPQTGVVDSFNARKDLEVSVAMDWGGEQPCLIPVRVTQPLAGADHGSILVPAIQSEVVVHFIDGVPERPVLIGALYNKHSKAAWASAPGGDEDKPSGLESIFKSKLLMIGKRGPTSSVEVDDGTANSEKISMHAINDVDVVIDRDETTHTKGKLTEKVTGDVAVTLEAKRSTKVTSDETYETNGNVSITVHKAGRVLVNQTLQMTADTKLSLISGNTRADFSPTAAKITVGSSTIEATASSIKVTVGGSVIELTAAAIKLSSGGSSIEVMPAVAIKGSVVNVNSGSLVVT